MSKPGIPREIQTNRYLLWDEGRTEIGWLEEIKGDLSVMLTHFSNKENLLMYLHAKLNF